jgi:membrane-bound lytic murein transglycosylase D
VTPARSDAVRLVARAGAALAIAVLTTSCAHHRTPQTAPTPAPLPATAVAPTPTPTRTPAAVPVDTGAAHPVDTTISHAAVTEQALRVFGDSVSHEIPLGPPADATAPATDTMAAPTWDIDVRSYETQQRVMYFIAEFSGPARDRFTQWVERGTRYEPLIRAKLRSAGLPEDLTYLALIESGYAPDAYSHAAAVGIWQLMTSTARGAGLRVDWWVDERRDPVRSTDAAIRFLRYLKDQFGSLYLAAAAYNGGPGRISRGLTRYAGDLAGTTGDDLFFALADKHYLREETRDYVPQLIAAALVAKAPLRYGMHVTPEPIYVYDTVRVGPATPLAAVGRAVGAPASAIAALNPFVLRGITPPMDSFTVRVPPGSAAAFDSAYAALPKSVREGYTATVTARKGDTFASLGHQVGLTGRQLAWYNLTVHPSPSGRIPGGSAVHIPSGAVVAAALDVPDPSIERYGTGGRQIHIVKSGESLNRIAERNHTTVAALMRLNGLRKSVILPGQALVISGAPARHSRRRRSPSAD